MHPAARTVPVAHPAPMAMLCRDLQRHVAPLEDPVDAMRKAGAAAHITLRGLHRHKTRQRQVRDRPALLGQGPQRSQPHHHGKGGKPGFHRRHSNSARKLQGGSCAPLFPAPLWQQRA